MIKDGEYQGARVVTSYILAALAIWCVTLSTHTDGPTWAYLSMERGRPFQWTILWWGLSASERDLFCPEMIGGESIRNSYFPVIMMTLSYQVLADNPVPTIRTIVFQYISSFSSLLSMNRQIKAECLLVGDQGVLCAVYSSLILGTIGLRKLGLFQHLFKTWMYHTVLWEKINIKIKKQRKDIARFLRSDAVAFFIQLRWVL